MDETSQRLAQAGSSSPELDARVLLAHVTGKDAAELLAGEVQLSAPQAAAYEQLVVRREQREPVAYLVGSKGFRRIELAVSADVLVPRPDTETLVAVAKVNRPCSILDVGTGSGAVALALADELPEATITAVDVSPAAVRVAANNAQQLGLDNRVTIRQSDLLDAVTGQFDCIVANLPYVCSDDYLTLEPEITRYEPRLALDGGPDGLDLIRRLVADAPRHLRPGGLIALELGVGQAEAVAKLLAQNGFEDIQAHQDLSGIDRVVSGRHPDADRRLDR